MTDDSFQGAHLEERVSVTHKRDGSQKRKGVEKLSGK